MTTQLIEKREVAKGTMEFRFAKPEGFTHEAGQTIDLTLINPPYTDEEGIMRTFSIASAPHEPYIAIATRMRESAFKRSLIEMAPHTEVSFTGPFGSFLLHENVQRPAVFIAGGIGITPFRAIALDAKERSLPHRLILVYSNRRPEDAPYLEELQSLSNVTLVPTMTDAQVGDTWQGERGYVTADLLSRVTPKDGAPVYYIAGPLAMVTAMRTLLKEMGVSSDDIRFEDFAGY
jgi:ferredoxin-NADP reductase